MKYITLILSLLLIVSCAHVDTTSPSVNIDGTWIGVWDSKGKYDKPLHLMILKLKSHGDTIAGVTCNATERPDLWIESEKVNLKGNKLSLKTKPISGVKVSVRGKIEGDIMNMTFKGSVYIFRIIPIPMFSGSVTLEREKSYDSTRELKVNGVSTNVMTFGLEKRDPKEPVIILQSGGFVPMEYWGSLIPLIYEYGPIIAYDRPGIGGSSFNGIDPTPEYVVDHLHELLKTLKVPPPYILVGHSWGGPLILYYAGRFPEEVAAMVYIDPTDPRQTAETLYMTSDKKKIAEMKAERDTRLDGSFDSNPGLQAENRVIEAFQDMPVEERNLPDNPIVPTAFILATLYENPGGFSYMTETWHKKRMELRISRFRNITQSLPQAELILAPDVGHNIPIEEPDLVAETIRQIMTQLQHPVKNVSSEP